SGDPINPYMSPKWFNRAEWTPDGFGLMLIVNRGLTFDYLAWYQPLVAMIPLAEKPTRETIPADAIWQIELPGTCSPSHFKKLELEEIGRFDLDFERLRSRFPSR